MCVIFLAISQNSHKLLSHFIHTWHINHQTYHVTKSLYERYSLKLLWCELKSSISDLIVRDNSSYVYYFNQMIHLFKCQILLHEVFIIVVHTHIKSQKFHLGKWFLLFYIETHKCRQIVNENLNFFHLHCTHNASFSGMFFSFTHFLKTGAWKSAKIEEKNFLIQFFISSAWIAVFFGFLIFYDMTE